MFLSSISVRGCWKVSNEERRKRYVPILLVSSSCELVPYDKNNERKFTMRWTTRYLRWLNYRKSRAKCWITSFSVKELPMICGLLFFNLCCNTILSGLSSNLVVTKSSDSTFTSIVQMYNFKVYIIKSWTLEDVLAKFTFKSRITQSNWLLPNG